MGFYVLIGGQNLPFCVSGTSLLSLACFWEEVGSHLAWLGMPAPVTKGWSAVHLWVYRGKCLQ